MMHEEARECGDPLMRRIDCSGGANWHGDGEGVVYSSNRDCPRYFDTDQRKEGLRKIQRTLPHEFALFTGP